MNLTRRTFLKTSASATVLTELALNAESFAAKDFRSVLEPEPKSWFRETRCFNADWTFAQVPAGEERRESVTNAESPDALKPGALFIPEPLEEPKAVRLPHDWGIYGPFDLNPKTWGGQGKLPWRGVGWYTKKFTLTEDEAKKRVVFDFGGCMAFPEIYVNGVYVGGWDYGYMSFQLDVTDRIHAGENEIAVRCDTRRHGSRWYPGAGIYRPVKMILTSRDAWLPEGSVFVTTPEVSAEKAVVEAQITPKFREGGAKNWDLALQLTDPDGNPVECKPEVIQNEKTATARFTVPDPTLWSVDAPKLYRLQVSLLASPFRRGGDEVAGGVTPSASPFRGGGDEVAGGVALKRSESKPLPTDSQVSREEGPLNRVFDQIELTFGIRKIEWTADDGFHLNGRRVQLHGVNLHHDQGILGSAAHPVAIERQLRIMKEMGANAIRTSHNPSSREFLDLCDRLGFIVWDELFDKWEGTSDLLDQNFFDAYTLRQAKRFVERDRNHPCVCVWSIGNEIWDVEQNIKGGSNPNLDAQRRVTHVAECFRQFDRTRPVGMGCFVEGSCGPESHVRDALDVSGWNYGAKYREARARYPEMPLLYTESASAVSSRGFYQLPHPICKESYDSESLQVDGYDWVSASGPRDIPDVDFDRMETDRYVAGEFVWTGFDYIGEPTPFDRQARSSYFGIVDLCGIPKDRFFLYRAYWAPEKTTVHILPHWNWAGKQEKVPVYVYTNGDSAELFLNGKSLGFRKKAMETPQPATQEQEGAKPENLWPETVHFSASSEEVHARGVNAAKDAFDGRYETRWCASDKTPNQWLMVDFGELVPFKPQQIVFEKPCKNYDVMLEISPDGQSWEPIPLPQAAGSELRIPGIQGKTARYFRLKFGQILNGAWASVREWNFGTTRPADPQAVPEYYKVINKYRLRWEDVSFEPGTLEAVAYRDGKEIGRETVRTAGEPVAVRLTPEKGRFASGDDLIYVLIEAVDSIGTPCPWDSRKVSASVTGPAEIVGIDAGNPMCFETIADAEQSLFYGKAVLVLRSRPGVETGTVKLSVQAEGLKEGFFVCGNAD